MGQITTGLPADHFSDSYAALDPAMRLAQAWKMGTFTLDPGAYFYPTFYTYVLALTTFFFGSWAHPEFLGRLLTTLFSLFTAVPAYFLGRRLFSSFAGLVAAAFVCLGFAFVLEGRYPSPNTPRTTPPPDPAHTSREGRPGL
jgi:4-amino-4-deoxy-L-arabinose transferase-like glycosyltransferase